MKALLQHCRLILNLALSDGTPVRAAKLAFVVGTLLVVINQWEALMGQEALSVPKLLLTYAVPYLVYTYTSVSKDLQARKALD